MGVKYSQKICKSLFKPVEISTDQIEELVTIEKINHLENLMCANIFRDFDFFDKKIFIGYLLGKQVEYADNILMYNNLGYSMRGSLGRCVESVRLAMQELCNYCNINTKSRYMFNQIYYTVVKGMDIDYKKTTLAIYWPSDWEEIYDSNFGLMPVEFWDGYIGSLIIGVNGGNAINGYTKEGEKFLLFETSNKDYIISKLEDIYSKFGDMFWYNKHENVSSIDIKTFKSVFNAYSFGKMYNILGFENRDITYIETSYN